jgi:S-adenosylmethionine:tRNA ribosyltransferase-isomerase
VTKHQLEDFNFSLPEGLIAKKPIFPRDTSQMLKFDKKISDRKFTEIADFFDAGDVFVFNNAKVIKAKLIGFRDQIKIEINLNAKFGDFWQIFAKPAKRLKIGDKIIFAEDFFAEVINKNSDGTVNVNFNQDSNLAQYLEKYGQIPIPPYLKRDSNEDDIENYQTIYAKNAGAVAAPTAGLHFSQKVINQIISKKIKIAFVTLNVGAGTFLPVKSDNISQHKMHKEYYEITPESCEVINSAVRNKKRIIAIGTTSLRVLESCAKNGLTYPTKNETGIFIYPPYNFQIATDLLTNFHLPKSTLLMLISAFVGFENVHKIYQHAIENKYRFFSYGDCCLFTHCANSKSHI